MCVCVMVMVMVLNSACMCVLKRNSARTRTGPVPVRYRSRPTTARTQGPQMGGGVDPVSAREQAESLGRSNTGRHVRHEGFSSYSRYTFI